MTIDYPLNPIRHFPRHAAIVFYKSVLKTKDVETQRLLCQSDLFYLLLVGLNRKDINADWLFDRCREVEANPDGMLDLWAREHYKSTIITYAKTIQDILIDPEDTFGIFSCTRPIAKAFLNQIKTEFEDNEYLKSLFPDILYQNPRKESPSWSLDKGILVKRKSNPKEHTIEASGIIDGMPTSKHYRKMVYDDVITERHVTSPEMIQDVTEKWRLSLNLGARGGEIRYAGTRYHFNDTYRVIIDQGTAAPRIYPATEDGTVHGAPVLLTHQEIATKRRDQGPYIFSCQLLMNPVEDSNQGFNSEWLRYHNDKPKQAPADWNCYLLCDPANEKKQTNDYTVMLVIALAPDNNYYLIDGVRDRLNLTERTNQIFRLHRMYQPVGVGYEKYGIQSDIQHIQYVMEQQQYRFDISELGGAMPKNDRIRRLVPVFEQGRMWFPRRLLFTDTEGKEHDFIQEFTTYEFDAFPVAVHDDMLDCMARIADPAFDTAFPTEVTPARSGGTVYKANTQYDPLGGSQCA